MFRIPPVAHFHLYVFRYSACCAGRQSEQRQWRELLPLATAVNRLITLFSRTNEPASTSPAGYLSNLLSTNYTELTTLRYERFHRRALLESQTFARIVDDARFARRIHDMPRFVGKKLGMGSNAATQKCGST